MAWAKACKLPLVLLAFISLAYAGIVCAQTQSTDKRNDNGVGGTASTGTGVKTGKGPLSHPIPPAVSTTNPQPTPQRPQNMQGPTQTNPPEQPFGSR
jgi:hypothetical protein